MAVSITKGTDESDKKNNDDDEDEDDDEDDDELDYDEIEIIISTNIPGANDEETIEIILTGLSLGRTEKKKPFFSPSIAYDAADKRFFNSLNDKKSVFFNERLFAKFLKECKLGQKKAKNEQPIELETEALETDTASSKEGKDEKKEAKDDDDNDILGPTGIAQRNVNFMMMILFEKTHRISSTYAKEDTQLLDRMIDIAGNPSRALGVLLKKRNYAALHHNGKRYIIMHSVWLNEFMTHPGYKLFSRRLKRFNNWTNKNEKHEIASLKKKYESSAGTLVNGYYNVDIVNVIFREITESTTSLEKVTSNILNHRQLIEKGGGTVSIDYRSEAKNTFDQLSKRGRKRGAAADIDEDDGYFDQLWPKPKDGDGEKLEESFNTVHTKIKRGTDVKNGADLSLRTMMQDKRLALEKFIKYVYNHINDINSLKDYREAKKRIEGDGTDNEFNNKLRDLLNDELKDELKDELGSSAKDTHALKSSSSSEHGSRSKLNTFLSQKGNEIYTGVEKINGIYRIYLEVDVSGDPNYPGCGPSNYDLGHKLSQLMTGNKSRSYYDGTIETITNPNERMEPRVPRTLQKKAARRDFDEQRRDDYDDDDYDYDAKYVRGRGRRGDDDRRGERKRVVIDEPRRRHADDGRMDGGVGGKGHCRRTCRKKITTRLRRRITRKKKAPHKDK